MRWKIGECEFNSISQEIRPASGPPLGEPSARLLEILIKRYGIQFEYGSKYENRQLKMAVWGKEISDASLYKSVEHLRSAFGEERRSYVLAKPFRLAVKPQLIEADELVRGWGIEFSDPDRPSPEPLTEKARDSKPEFALIVDGMIINSVAELLFRDRITEGIANSCAASYERCLEDIAFATVYASRLVTGKDFRPSLTAPDQPGQEVAARLGEICDQQVYPNDITGGRLLLTEKTRDGIRDDMQRFAKCMADRTNAHYFRDYMLREGTKHLGTDNRLFQEDIDPGDYKYDVGRPYYQNRQLQDDLGNAADVLVSYLPKTPRDSTDRYATNALKEFASRNVLSLITIMWEGKEFAKRTKARRAPHILRALVEMRRSKDRGDTQHQEIVRNLVVEHALTAALRSSREKNRHNILGLLLNLRDDYPFKQIRRLLNEEHLVLVEADPTKEQAARKVLKQLKALTESASVQPERVHLAHASAIRALGGNKSGEYEYELLRVFPELAASRRRRGKKRQLRAWGETFRLD